jgi:galacturan 1,4-alpha-galacturonidase
MDLSAASTSNNAAKNTDGWDIYRSDNVVIQDSHIKNGDDCVSFKPNSTNIVVQGLVCNGSHGISVGSLGQYVLEYDIVENVYVYNTSMSDASDGARIKIWPGINTPFQPSLSGGGGSGYVRNVTYENFENANNDWAIELTQCYGQSNQTICNMYPVSWGLMTSCWRCTDEG